MTLSEIEDVLAAKEEFDRMIMRDPNVTPREREQAWEAWKRRWRWVLLEPKKQAVKS